jgi:outer membrane protein TolC
MRKIGFVLVVLLSTTLSQAQTKLSMADAIQMCLKNNFDILIEDKNIEAAVLNNKWSEAGMFPTFSLNLSNQNGINDNSNNPFTFQPGITSNISVTPSINMEWNLFNGLSVFRNKERLVRLENQTRGNSMLVIENSIHSLIKAYYQAVLNQMKVGLMKEILNFSKEKVKYFEIKSEVGTSNSIDVLQFKTQLYTDSMNLELLRLNYRNSLRNMNMMMGIPIDSMFVLTDSLTKDLPAVTYDRLAELMYSSNQNLKNQYINLELQQTNTKLSGSMLYPTLSFQASAAPNWGWFRSFDVDSIMSTSSINYNFGFNLRYTIFNNWKNKRAYKVGKIQEEIAQIRIEDMELELDNNLKNQIDSYDQRRRMESLSFQNAEYSKAVWEMGQEQYNMGSISSFDLTTLRNNYLNTLVNYFDNLYNLVDSYTELYKMTGGIVRAVEEKREINPVSPSDGK